MRLVDIGDAGFDDALELARIHVTSWRVAYKGLIADEVLATRTVERRLREWEEHLALPPGRRHDVFVARDDGRILGFCRSGRADDADVDRTSTYCIFGLYLDPAARGRGVGVQLVEHALASARARGFDRTILYVLIENDAARRFYERHGFVEEPDVVTECLGDGAEAPQVRYTRSLDDLGSRTPAHLYDSEA